MLARIKSIFNGHTYTVLFLAFSGGIFYWQVQANQAQSQQQGTEIVSEIRGLRVDLNALREDFASAQIETAIVRERVARLDAANAQRFNDIDRRLYELSRDSIRWSDSQPKRERGDE